MANWTNATKGRQSNVKVTFHEKEEDATPDLYIKRGELFFENKQFAQAEAEYLKAVKFSGREYNYIVRLVNFYYATKEKSYERKADRLYNDYMKKTVEENWRKESIFPKFLCFCILIYSGSVGAATRLGHGRMDYGNGVDIFMLVMVVIGWLVYLWCCKPQEKIKWFNRGHIILWVLRPILLLFLTALSLVIVFPVLEMISTRISMAIVFIIGLFGCLSYYNKLTEKFYASVQAWSNKRPNSKFRGCVKTAIWLFRIVAVIMLVTFEIQFLFGH